MSPNAPGSWETQIANSARVLRDRWVPFNTPANCEGGKCANTWHWGLEHVRNRNSWAEWRHATDGCWDEALGSWGSQAHRCYPALRHNRTVDATASPQLTKYIRHHGAKLQQRGWA